ncbi:TetR/AcrR family transcriptional regulator [Herbaspirillum huttiense]|uniref:TetR/AcrR family transcriptional regulator n=1 Tax=Herbaspirillum huttiense TaxID=863372 RepID=UPI002E78F361|nr:TetR/AcrR family transcriptional regulator [Herbaspirillum huttiense]MEE1638319.1 TetR/AcrR family transcriptional regulator [Herbaspirillum huttiense NC40101]
MNKSTSTADDILACARSLIIAGGYNGFSYADIADVVGIRKPSIHHHFPSKAELVKKLVETHRAQTELGVENLARVITAPRDQLRAYVDHWKTCIEDSSAPFCVAALLASEMPILPEEVAEQVRGYFRFLSGWLTAVLERGLANKSLKLTHAPHVEAEVLMATVHGAMLSARAYGDAEIFGTIMDTQLARLSAKK